MLHYHLRKAKKVRKMLQMSTLCMYLFDAYVLSL